ncbi:MAG: hypothetical protein AAF192_00280 [Pseudomonadota bacterium]
MNGGQPRRRGPTLHETVAAMLEHGRAAQLARAEAERCMADLDFEGVAGARDRYSAAKEALFNAVDALILAGWDGWLTAGASLAGSPAPTDPRLRPPGA